MLKRAAKLILQHHFHYLALGLQSEKKPMKPELDSAEIKLAKIYLLNVAPLTSCCGHPADINIEYNRKCSQKNDRVEKYAPKRPKC